jgi:hypothetical protein
MLAHRHDAVGSHFFVLWICLFSGRVMQTIELFQYFGVVIICLLKGIA